jgi:hypothetical protein
MKTKIFSCPSIVLATYENQTVFKHQQAIHHCANMAWVAKGSRGLPLSILHAFSRQRVLVTMLQLYFNVTSHYYW